MTNMREVFDQIGANRLDVLNHPRKIAEGVLGILDQLVDRIFRRIAAELARFIAPLRLPSRDLANNMLEVLLQRFDRRPALSRRLASGQVPNSSGGTTLPSLTGASANPSGVLSRAISFSAALSRSEEKASPCLLLE